MALLTDGSVATIDDMAARDSQLLATANTENIDVTQKLMLALDDLSLELSALLNAALARPGDFGQPVLQTAQPGIGNIVVTPALKLWHTYSTLEMVYADAYNSQLNDRYGRRRDQFHELAGGARERLRELGIGVASDPEPRAATPSLTPAAGAPTPLPDGTYYATVAWTNRCGEEGWSALPASLATMGSTLMVAATDPPPNAAGWNVYVGDSPDTMVRQNSLPIGTAATWLQPGALVKTGQAPGEGQSANYLLPLPRVLQRG